ncbi:MAG: gcvT, partial [Nocardioidaceae bacterium]|nr:gcvT [Nocardioidaceae bacterium]
DEVLTSMGLPTDHAYMSFTEAEIAGVPVTVCRTGYTGERGYELVVPSDSAPSVWAEIMRAGEAYEIRACGLAARDTLRTEMGYALHGHELSMTISPVMARVGWAVGWKKPHFWGKDTLEAQKAGNTVRLTRGLLAQGRGIPRPGMTVSAEGSVVGEVTSGTFSPTLRQGIALALLDPTQALGDSVTVDVRGRQEVFTVVAPPFISPSVKES